MEVNALYKTDPWDWPENTAAQLLSLLNNPDTPDADLIKVVEMAGNHCVINDDLVAALINVVGRDSCDETVRGRAAISLGPVLEDVDLYGFEDPDEVPISESTYQSIEDTFEKLYFDVNVPKEVRRRILEASVRAPQSWHKEAIQEAYEHADNDWQLTAVFCMTYVHGFKKHILKALDSDDPEIQYEAVCAAGTNEIDAAWPHIEPLLTLNNPNKPLLLAAIDASIQIKPKLAGPRLNELLESDDQDVVDAVYEAMAMAGFEPDDGLEYDDYSEEDEEYWD